MQHVKTRFLVVPDTHAHEGHESLTLPDLPVDVAIHCGDLTEQSKLQEMRTSLHILRKIHAPLKLVIAGNHDFTLDDKIFQQNKAQAEAAFDIDPELMAREYGSLGDARQLFDNAKADGITFLDPGVHHFHLANGANLTVYASPYTPSPEADWGFQYKRGEHHDFAIPQNIHVVITHGPPKGLFDMTADRQRGGCEHLFAAVARARPRLHCFGHMHEGWGAKIVSWRDTQPGEIPSHFNAIDNDRSTTLDNLAALRAGKWDTPQDITEKENHVRQLRATGYPSNPIQSGRSTLFVNAAIKSSHEEQHQLPWIVDIELPAAIQ
ncbi:Metallo-dependent phosphatase-like protein [Rhypophila sp. PSN 637]